MALAGLRDIQRVAKYVDDIGGQRAQVLLAAAHPYQRLRHGMGRVKSLVRALYKRPFLLSDRYYKFGYEF
jgi:hypothetical protein